MKCEWYSDFTRDVHSLYRQGASGHGHKLKIQFVAVSVRNVFTELLEDVSYFTALAFFYFTQFYTSRPSFKRGKVQSVWEKKHTEAWNGKRKPNGGTPQLHNYKWTTLDLNDQQFYPSGPGLQRATNSRTVCNPSFKGLHQGTYSCTRKMSCQIQDTWRYIVINNSNNMHKVTYLFREWISLSRYKKNQGTSAHPK